MQCNFNVIVMCCIHTFRSVANLVLNRNYSSKKASTFLFLEGKLLAYVVILIYKWHGEEKCQYLYIFVFLDLCVMMFEMFLFELIFQNDRQER